MPELILEWLFDKEFKLLIDNAIRSIGFKVEKYFIEFLRFSKNYTKLKHNINFSKRARDV